MAYLTGDRALQVLPIELSGQVFAFSMDDVVGIYRASAGADGELPSGNQHPASLPIVDLRHFFWAQAGPETNMYVVVVSTGAATCALGVDKVRPTRTMTDDALHPLPRLISTVEWLFNGVVSESDNLMLLINAPRLVDQIRQMSPHLVAVEGAYVS